MMVDTSTFLTSEETNVVRKTIEVIQTKGWTKGFFEDPAGAHCLVGALFLASKGISSYGELPPTGVEYTKVYSTLTQKLQILAEAPMLISWNDNQTDSKAVIALLEKALHL